MLKDGRQINMANIIEILMKQVGAEKVAGSFGKVTKQLKSATVAAAKYTAVAGVMIAGAAKLVEIHGQQARAEKQLEVALGKTSQALLNQASALQKSTRFGDEAIIQQQAFLASLQFTEKEIKQMIPAALDLAEATGMDLASAVKNMAKTFSGMQGELGELIPQLKTLTKEEMIAGGAVGLINELFGGQAKAAAEATKGIDQLKMTMGDLAEVAGSKLAPAMNIVGLAFANILQGAPGSEWWEGVAIGMEAAATESAKLSIQAGGIDRLINSYDDLAFIVDANLVEAFQSVGLEYDEHSSREENLQFLMGMSEVTLRKYIQTRKEERVALEEEKKAVEDVSIAYDSMAIRISATDQATLALQKSSKKSIGTFQGEYAPVVNDLSTDFQKFEQMSATAFAGTAQAATAAADIIAATSGDDKRRQILAMRIAQFAALVNTGQAVTKALASGAPPWNFINAAAVGSAGALQIAGIESAISSARSAATGLDEVFDRPTMIQVGDRAGGEPERVTVEPEGQSGRQVTEFHIHVHAPISRQTVRNEILPELKNASRLGYL